MADKLRQRLTIFDVMVLVAASAVGAWGAAAYKDGIPLPIIGRPGLPVLPLLLSVPIAAAATGGFLAVPAGTLRGRARRVFRQPGTALCAAAVAALLGVVIRCSLRAWISPYVDGSLWIYGAQVLYDWARTCGQGIMAAMALLVLGGKFRWQAGWVEWVRLALAAYWISMFVIFSVL